MVISSFVLTVFNDIFMSVWLFEWYSSAAPFFYGRQTLCADDKDAHTQVGYRSSVITHYTFILYNIAPPFLASNAV